MIFQSQYPIDIPTTDTLSWLFDDQQYDVNRPLYLDANNPQNYLTGARLKLLVKQIGKGLRALVGVAKGDVILVCSGNTVLFPAVYFGILCAGCIFTGANPAYRERELTHHLLDSGARVIFASPDTFRLAQRCGGNAGIDLEKVILMTDEPQNLHITTLFNLTRHGKMEWDRLTGNREVSCATAVLNYSSGTTGHPKGCEISHRNIVANTMQILHMRDIGNRRQRQKSLVVTPEICCAFLPFYHAFGQLYHMVRNVKTGDPTYLMATYLFEEFLRTIQTYRITSLAIVPPVVVSLGKFPKARDYDLSSVRYIICGGAGLGVEATSQAQKVLHPSEMVKIRQDYGLTETTMTATWWSWDDAGTDVTGTGRLLPGVESKIIDEEGREVGYEKEGEIFLRGPNVFRGYWKNEEATRDAFTHDGWFKTGDVGFVKPDGVFHIVGRKKELIKVKGFSVAPAEIEDVLLESDDVADAAVVPVIIDHQEHPRAYVVPTRTGVSPSAVMDFAAANLAPYKRLTGGVVLVDSIPKSGSGKILRAVLLERHVQGPGRAKL